MTRKRGTVITQSVLRSVSDSNECQDVIVRSCNGSKINGGCGHGLEQAFHGINFF